MLGIGGDSQFLPHLEAHPKVFGNLRQVVPELIRGRGTIERGIVADRTEQRLAIVEILAIFAEALPGERSLGVLTQVDLTLPAFVRPS